MRKKKILVIDDDPSVGTRIAETLGPRGFDVLSVADPMEGVEKARKTEPDLFFISLLSTDSNGLRVSKTLHADERLKAAPIVMLISYQGELDPKYTTTIGVVDVLVKPFTPKDVISITKKILGSDDFSPGVEETVPGGPAGGESEISSSDVEWFSEPGPEFVQETDTALKEKTPAPGIDEYNIFGSDKRTDRDPEKGNDFPAAKEIRKEDTFGEDEFYFESEPKGPMKKIVVIAATVLVITILGVGAFQIRKYLYPGTAKKIPSHAVKASAARKGPTKEHTHEKETKPMRAEVKSPKEEKEKDEVTYSVQLGVFSNAQNALSLVNKMKEKGYDVFIEEDGSGKRSRVLIGRFDDKKKALDRSALILQKEGIKTIIYRR